MSRYPYLLKYREIVFPGMSRPARERARIQNADILRADCNLGVGSEKLSCQTWHRLPPGVRLPCRLRDRIGNMVASNVPPVVTTPVCGARLSRYDPTLFHCRFRLGARALVR
jgi:hypothetical protein